jgi:RNA polymerase sigma-70 factor (ECF subfamily)
VDDLGDDVVLVRLRTEPGLVAVLYRRHARAVLSYLVRRVDTNEAEDLLSEVFAAALSARNRVVPHVSGSALPWLYGIAGNVVRYHLRNAHVGDQPVDGETTVDWDAVDDRLDAETRRVALRRALDGLTLRERELLLLVAWEGLTPSQAAQALGISAGAARFRLYRARQHARRLLASDAPVQRDDGHESRGALIEERGMP